MLEESASEISPELERIFRRQSGLIFRTAYRITGRASDAEDVLQDVFLRFLRRSPDAPPLENEEGYFRRAAIHGALDMVRERSKEKVVPLLDLPAEPSRPPSDLKETLRQGLARLKPRDAEIFALRFFEEYTNPEIARMLGISQVLVAVIVHRVRRQMQKEIGIREEKS